MDGFEKKLYMDGITAGIISICTAMKNCHSYLIYLRAEDRLNQNQLRNRVNRLCAA